MRRLAVLLLLPIVACASHPAPAPTPTPTPAPAPAPKGPSLDDLGINSAWLDRTVDPCTDLYRFTCGGLHDHVPIPPDRPSWGPTEIVDTRAQEDLRRILEQAVSAPGDDPVAKKLGAWYSACMDEAEIDREGLTPLKPLFDVIAKVTDRKSLLAAIAELHKYGISVAFRIEDAVAYDDATQVVAFLDQRGLGLPERDYYLENDERKEARTYYRGHVERMLALLGGKPEDAARGAEDVMRIETALATLAMNRVDHRDPKKSYHRVDRAGLVKAARGIDWNAYFAGLGFPELKGVAISSAKYLAGVDELLGKEKPAAWRAYLTWHVLHEIAPFLGKAFVDEHFALEHKMRGIETLPPRWKRCVKSADEHLGELLGQAFVRERFSPEAKRDVEDMVATVRAAMRAELQSLTWMDDATRTAAVEKLDKMGQKIGYPSVWKTYDYELGKSYVANVLISDAYEAARKLKRVGKPVDRTLWDMTTPTVNAYYEESRNEIVFPAGILQPPFYGVNLPLVVNYGETATVMGHEITHGFDDNGAQFDAAGNLRDWWSKGTAEKFKSQVLCVIDQYDPYEPLPGIHVNGAATAGENIADIGGTKVAYAAFHAARAKQGGPPVTAGGFTEDQLFFVAFGQMWCWEFRPEDVARLARTDEHSPVQFRVKGSVSDLPAFGEAFQCKPGAPLRPDPKKICEPW
jgi:predicted metalloendopeptidase